MITNNITERRASRPNGSGRGITMAHLARQIRMSRSYVLKLERGMLQPSAEAMFRIARYFGRPIEEVFQFLDKK